MTYKIEFEHWRIWEDFWFSSTGRPDPRDLWRYTKNCGWKPAGHGGKTICRIRCDGKIIATGEAVCSMSDNFCYRTGRDLAFLRAYEKLTDDQIFVASKYFFDIKNAFHSEASIAIEALKREYL